MTNSEDRILKSIKDENLNGYILFDILMKRVLKNYSYDDRWKIQNGLVKNGYLKRLARNGYTTNYKLLY